MPNVDWDKYRVTSADQQEEAVDWNKYRIKKAPPSQETNLMEVIS